MRIRHICAFHVASCFAAAVKTRAAVFTQTFAACVANNSSSSSRAIATVVHSCSDAWHPETLGTMSYELPHSSEVEESFNPCVTFSIIPCLSISVRVAILRIVWRCMCDGSCTEKKIGVGSGDASFKC